MEEFELVEEALNVKVLMNIYMKNLRFISHDPEHAIENLKKVIILSTHVCGEDVKYKHSQINFEIGRALSASLAKYKEGREYIEKGRAILEEMYGKDHASMVKYFSFISMQESIEDKSEALCQLSPKIFNFIKSKNLIANESGDKESLFLLEAYHDQIAMIGDSGGSDGSS